MPLGRLVVGARGRAVRRLPVQRRGRLLRRPGLPRLRRLGRAVTAPAGWPVAPARTAPLTPQPPRRLPHPVTRSITMQFREMTVADMPALFDVRPRTRENALTVEELRRLGITPQSVAESLAQSAKGWVCEDVGRVVAFSMADRATAELLVVAVLPEYEGKGVGGRLMALAEDWLAAVGLHARVADDGSWTPRLRAYGFYRKRGWTDWKIERGLRWMEFDLRSRRPSVRATRAALRAGRLTNCPGPGQVEQRLVRNRRSARRVPRRIGDCEHRPAHRLARWSAESRPRTLRGRSSRTQRYPASQFPPNDEALMNAGTQANAALSRQRPYPAHAA
ncbi:MAG: GNAT family N-acetyltransferase [Comamonadaceae bacterium]|nr:GNAT family N-acetyltransferase [Comamonadaceae bacterium]